MMGFDAH